MVTCGEIKVLRESVTRMLFFSVNFEFKSLLSAFIKKKTQKCSFSVIKMLKKKFHQEALTLIILGVFCCSHNIET